MFVLDTNTLIHALKGRGRVRERIAGVSPDQVGIPAVVVYELEWGTLRAHDPDKRRKDLARILSVVDVLPLDRDAAERSAKIRRELERKGETIGPLDLLIAGIAMARGGTLVTHNVTEFGRIPGLAVEDWY